MKIFKVLLDNCNILNLLLFIVAIIVFIKLDIPLINKGVKIEIPKPRVTEMTNTEKHQESNAAYLDYVVITDKNLFHPERMIVAEKKEDISNFLRNV